MKKYCVFTFIFLLFISCKQENKKNFNFEKEIVGKWRITENPLGDKNKDYYNKLPDSMKIFEFKEKIIHFPLLIDNLLLFGTKKDDKILRNEIYYKNDTLIEFAINKKTNNYYGDTLYHCLKVANYKINNDTIIIKTRIKNISHPYGFIVDGKKIPAQLKCEIDEKYTDDTFSLNYLNDTLYLTNEKIKIKLKKL